MFGDGMMKEARSRKVIKWVAFALFSLYAFSLLVPLYYMILNSFKTNLELFTDPWGMPKKFSFGNYVRAFSGETFKKNNLALMFLNSSIFTFGSTAVSLIAVTTFAYTTTRFDFFGRKALKTLALVMFIVPPMGTFAATFKFVYDIGLNDNWLYIVVMNLSPFGLGYFMVAGFFEGVSKTYAEAARLDGASELTLFLKIMVPQVVPVLAVLGLLGIIGAWNNYETPFYFFRTKPFLSTGLRTLASEATNRGYYVEMYAAMIVAMAPIIILFSFCHDVILKNTVLGGIKG